MPPTIECRISFSKSMLAVLLLAFAIAMLAGAAAGDGTMVVTLDDDIVTQEDTTLTYNSAVSYTGSLVPTYHWDFGDGITSSLQRPSHAYTKAGNYTVTLTVADSDGVTDSDSLYVEVLNVRPIADAGGDKTVNEGTTVTFDGSNSWDTASDLPLLTYEWDFGDGASTGASKDNKVVTHTYADAGVYLVRLVVRDDDWSESNYAKLESQLLVVEGSATGNGTVTFTYGTTGGSGSNGTGGGSGSNVTYDVFWDFGDGDYAAGPNVTHTYESDGLYVVTLILTDAFGAMSVHHLLVTVLNSPPTAEAGPDMAGDEDESLEFAGSGTDPGGGALTYSWDFGDGATGSGQSTTHAFTQSGTYTVTLTVTDSDGLSDTDTCTATVGNVAPVAAFTTSSATYEGDVITFYGTSTTDTASDLPLLQYIWQFGDGTTASGSTATHAYADEGTYTVRLTVTDDDQASSSTTTTLSLANAAPSATIVSMASNNTDVLPGDNVTFTGSGTDPGSADTLSCSWSFGDGATATGTSAIHAYASAGNYTVTLTVTDNDGASGTASTVLWVKTLGTLTTEGQTLVDEAPKSAFDKKQDQAFISDLFDDLLDALVQNNTNQIDSRIHVLRVQIDIKVTDETLKAKLMDILDNLDDSV